jgi:Asp-tRNA(Asn)/Glu-tRNA(Gln) amidotransferase A subunit family amidase
LRGKGDAERVVLLTEFCVIDDPEIFDGAHVSVQLVGRRLQEEKMIALAEYVGEALRK